MAKSSTLVSSSTNGGKQAQVAGRRGKAKPNGSILNFFQKVEPSKGTIGSGVLLITNDKESLFVKESTAPADVLTRCRSETPDLPDSGFGLAGPEGDFPDDRYNSPTEGTRYNEDAQSDKRRRVGSPEDGYSVNNGDPAIAVPGGATQLDQDQHALPHIADLLWSDTKLETAGAGPIDRDCSPKPGQNQSVPVELKSSHLPLQPGHSPQSRTDAGLSSGLEHQPDLQLRLGPFVEDNDSDDDKKSAGISSSFNWKETAGNEQDPLGQEFTDSASAPGEVEVLPGRHAAFSKAIPPSLTRESTSIYDVDEFAGVELDDEEYEEGEEYLERRLMEEQGRLELAESGFDESYDETDQESTIQHLTIDDGTNRAAHNSTTATCPLCDYDLGGLTDNNAQVHVNNCLDGNQTPLPEITDQSHPSPVTNSASGRSGHHIKPPKPGQASPFDLGSQSRTSSSAFSRLMSSHAEDAAWATAAAAEQAARGKPAFQRTCPFYKIMPGFFICVDAFRYGAVEGCQAYFLSHFHSDHYIGLTSTWARGPIYCSRITGNLVRQQLRVDPKYVVDLEFEHTLEVPGTNGVRVTMIPANHCPGSSLFLFEKVIGKGKTPKVQRVLHCGDFRACPAHLHHPLLRPDLLDIASGKCIGQQKIDVCYLDTTYLNPKYAFPNQEQVINACAAMCVSLRKEQMDHDDDWERMKRQRAGNGMTKFVRTDSNEVVKGDKAEDEIDAMKVNSKCSGKNRGRLLVVVGTYSIGKERICLGIARALDSKIFAPPGKQKICACLEDAELSARLTSDPYEAQIHMTPLFEIRAETLQDYLNTYKPHFSRIVGFRPSGWNYKPPNSRFVESPAVQTVLQSNNWKSSYSMAELVPQRGSTREASCFGVPYSEHSSFRELTMFCCALRIDKIIPTVNVGSAKSREKMKAWFEKWAAEKKKNGLYRIAADQQAW